MEILNGTETVQAYEKRWWAFLVLALTIMIVVIDHTILNVALPTLQRELGATISELQWIVDAYILVLATLLFTTGTLGDRIGRAVMLRTGMIVFGLAGLGAVLAGNPGHLIAARIAMGIGAAMITPATLAIITNIFPPEERVKAIGLWGAVNGIGVALGPLLGGFLLEHFNWNAVFFINIPIVLTALAGGWFLIPNSYDPSPRRLDIRGTCLSAITMWLLVFGLIKGSDWGWMDPRVITSLIGFAVAGYLFIRRETKADAPMLDLHLFKNPRLSAGSSSIAIMNVAMFGLFFALTMYMQFVKNYSAMETGIRFLPLAFGYALGSVTSNRINRFLGTKSVVTVGFVGIGVLAPIIAFWRPDTPYWQIGIFLLVMSYFMGSIMTPSLNAVLGAVPQARAGVGSAIGSVSFQVGGALGVAALGSVLSSAYKASIESALAPLVHFPAEIIDAAGESIGAAMTVAGMMPDGARQNLVLLAGTSFMEGWQVVLVGMSFVAVAGAFFTLIYMPQQDVALKIRE